MPPIEIIPVRSRGERDAFIKFPWRIYANDPVWVPPLLLERKEFLNRKKHPFYEHGEAALFLACSGGEIVGRILVSDDPKYNALHQSNAGCFGMFESIDDQSVATALFEAAAKWLRARGRDEVMGPIDYSTNYVCGLLIEGFQHPPVLLTSHNPSFYSRLLEGWGFEKAIDLYAWWMAKPDEVAARLRPLVGRFERWQGATIRPVSLKDFAEESRRIREIYNEAWEKNWGFVPFSPREFAYMARELKQLVIPGAALIAEVGDRPVGFVLGVPDINVALRHLNGRLTSFGLPIGLAKLLYYKSKTRIGRLIALGVVPEFRRHGIAEMLVLKVMEEGMIRRGFTGELSLTLENNHRINRFIKAVGAEKYKTYRIYRRRLEGTAAAVAGVADPGSTSDLAGEPA